jgi:putative spermidine/putrescine transport system permease protein
MLHEAFRLRVAGFVWQCSYRCFCAGVLVFLIAPVLIVIPLSFNVQPFFTITSGMLRLDPDAYSLKWYRSFLDNPQWMLALKNSAIIAFSAVIPATVLGTAAALGLNHPRLPFRNQITALLISPMIVPIIITATGLYFLYQRVGLTQTFTGIILAHILLGSPFVVLIVSSTLAGYDATLDRAAASLGAHPLRVFWQVTLPLILPGVLSGAILAFITSFDEIVVVLFLSGSDQRTIPRQMWTGIRDQISPTILAVATLLIVVSVLLMLALELLRARRAKLEGTRSSSS